MPWPWDDGDDPLAGYTPSWRQQLENHPFTPGVNPADDDPLAGYSPNWRSTLPTAQAMFSSDFSVDPTQPEPSFFQQPYQLPDLTATAPPPDTMAGLMETQDPSSSPGAFEAALAEEERRREELERAMRSPYEDFGRGMAAGAASGLTRIPDIPLAVTQKGAELAGYELPAVDEARETIGDMQQQAYETMDPQGLAGGIGSLAGELIPAGFTATLGARAVGGLIQKYGSATRMAEAIRAGREGTYLQRLLTQVATNAPIDVGYGVSMTEKGENPLPAIAENLGLSAGGSAVIGAFGGAGRAARAAGRAEDDLYQRITEAPRIGDEAQAYRLDELLAEPRTPNTEAVVSFTQALDDLQGQRAAEEAARASRINAPRAPIAQAIEDFDTQRYAAAARQAPAEDPLAGYTPDWRDRPPEPPPPPSEPPPPPSPRPDVPGGPSWLPEPYRGEAEPSWLDEVGPDGQGGEATVRQMREARQARPATWTDQSPERQALRLRLVDDLELRHGWEEASLDDVLPSGRTKREAVAAHPEAPPDQPKRAYIILGYPGSGKSTVIADRVYDEHPWARVIDADESKKTLPEYEGGANADVVHEESSSMNKMLLARTMAAGHDLILPIVGGNPATVQKYLDALGEKGYQVHLALNEVQKETAVERVIHRWRDRGRFVDPGLVYEAGEPSVSYELHRNHPAVTSWERWNNDAPIAEGAQRTEAGTRPPAGEPAAESLRSGGGGAAGGYPEYPLPTPAPPAVAPPAGPFARALEELQQPAALDVPRGTPTRIVANTGATEAEYAVLPAEQVAASNLPTDLGPFQRHPLHPGNERTYAPGSDQHLGVLRQAAEWNPRLVLNTDPTAVGGPPIVVPWTRELAEATGKQWEDVRGTFWTAGGNSRVMAQALLRQRGRGAIIDAANRNTAGQFGLAPDQVGEGSLIVRIAAEPVTTPAQARALVSRLNEVPTQALGVEEAAVSAGQKMSPTTRDWFGSVYDGDKPLRANLQSAAIARELRDRLTADGVLDASNRARFYRPDGSLTEEGKTFIERMMLGRAVPDATLLQTATPAMVAKIESIATLVDRSSVGGEAYDLRAPLAEILRRQGGQNVGLDRHLAQLDMLQEAPDESVTNLWAMLDHLSSRELREKLARYVDIVEKRVVRTSRPEQVGLGFEDATAVPTADEAWEAAATAQRPAYTTRGGVTVQTPGWIGGAAAGGAVGATGDEEDRGRGFLLGALGGAALGGVAVRHLARRRGVRPGGFEEALELVRRGPEEPPRPVSTVPIDPDEYVNVEKFALDPSGETRLRNEVTRIVQEQGIHPKQVVTWEETRAIANSLGLEDLPKEQVNVRLTGPQMLAIRNIVSTNLEALDTFYGRVPGLAQGDPELVRIDRAIGYLERENDALLGRFTRARTQTGRDLNNMKILANRVMDPFTWIAKAANMLEAGGKKLSPQQRDRIRELVDQGDKAELVQYVMALRPVSRVDQAVSLWKTGLLTNPKTHLANIVGNVSMAALETAKDLPAAIADRILGAVVTGQRAKDFSLTGTGKALWRGAKSGYQEAKRIVQHGAPPSDVSRWEISKDVQFKHPILRIYTEIVKRGLAAPDAFFRQVALHRSLAEAQRLGPITDEIALLSIADSEYAVFQGGGREAGVQSRLARVGEAARKHGGVIGQGVAPFVRTPGNIIGATIDYSPFGAIRGARDIYRLVKATRAGGSPAELRALQKAASEQLGRSATGTLAAFLGGMMLARSGKMTGARPMKGNEQEQWDLAGKMENAIKVAGRWWSVNRLSPIGNLLALGANTYQATQNPESGWLGTVAAGAASIGTTATEQTMLRGVQELHKAIGDPVGQGVKYAKHQVASVVPAAVGAVARGIDPVIRETRGGFLDTFLSRIPGLSKRLPAQVNQLGQERRRDFGIAGQMLDIGSSRPYRLDDPVIRELETTGASLGELNRGRGRPAEVRKLEAMIRNTQAPHTRALLERRLATAKEGEPADRFLVRTKVEGQFLNRYLTGLIGDRNYQRLPTEARREVLEAAIEKFRRQMGQLRRKAGM